MFNVLVDSEPVATFRIPVLLAMYFNNSTCRGGVYIFRKNKNVHNPPAGHSVLTFSLISTDSFIAL